jgi:hypothetical protein
MGLKRGDVSAALFTSAIVLATQLVGFSVGICALGPVYKLCKSILLLVCGAYQQPL